MILSSSCAPQIFTPRVARSKERFGERSGTIHKLVESPEQIYCGPTCNSVVTYTFLHCLPQLLVGLSEGIFFNQSAKPFDLLCPEEKPQVRSRRLEALHRSRVGFGQIL